MESLTPAESCTGESLVTHCILELSQTFNVFYLLLNEFGQEVGVHVFFFLHKIALSVIAIQNGLLVPYLSFLAAFIWRSVWMFEFNMWINITSNIRYDYLLLSFCQSPFHPISCLDNFKVWISWFQSKVLLLVVKTTDTYGSLTDMVTFSFLPVLCPSKYRQTSFVCFLPLLQHYL